MTIITNELKTIIKNYPELDIAAVKRQIDPEKKTIKKFFTGRIFLKSKLKKLKMM